MSPWIVQVGAAFLATSAFAVLFNIKSRDVVFAGLGGAVSWGTHMAVIALSGSNIASYLCASLAVGLYAELMAAFMKKPATIFIVCSIIPVVPGAGMYYTMLHAIRGNGELGLRTAYETLSLAGALASGLAITASISRIASIMSKNRIANRDAVRAASRALPPA